MTVTDKLSFKEARERFNASHPKKSFASAVRGPPSAPQSTPLTPATSLDRMSAAQLVLLLRSFGLTVVATGATAAVPAELVAPAPPTAQFDSHFVALCSIVTPQRTT